MKPTIPYIIKCALYKFDKFASHKTLEFIYNYICIGGCSLIGGSIGAYHAVKDAQIYKKYPQNMTENIICGFLYTGVGVVYGGCIGVYLPLIVVAGIPIYAIHKILKE